MRAELLLSQPNTGRAARLALKVAGGASVLYAVAATALFWNLTLTVKSGQDTLKTTRQQAAERRAAARRKREDAAHIGQVSVASPTGSGTADFTEELYHLASASGIEISSVTFTSSGPGAAAPPPPPPADSANANNAGNANAPGAANAGGASSGPTPAAATPAQDANGDDGWKRAPFECNMIGGFADTQDFLERLTRLARVLEITGMEMRRDRIDARTGVMRVHLKLNGVVFGQASKP